MSSQASSTCAYESINMVEFCKADLSTGTGANSGLNIQVAAAAEDDVGSTSSFFVRDSEEALPSKSQINDLQPIFKLPEDIILRIFVLLMTLNGGVYWRILTQICHNWRRIALGCASIWTNINYEDYGNKDIIRLLLERSRMAEIDVTFLRSDNHAIGINIIKLLKEHMQRVRSFAASTSADLSYQNLIQELLEESGQCLRSLCLQAIRSRKTLSLNPIQTFHLDNLDIRNISLPWNNSILRGLSSLTISNIKNTQIQPTLIEFLDILEACPMLRSLRLDKIHLGDPNIKSLEMRSIKLDYLESLHLYGIDSAAYSFLCSSIIKPKDVAWNIYCGKFPVSYDCNSIPNCPDRTAQCKSFSITFRRTSLKFVSREPVAPNTCLSFDWETIIFSRRLTNLLISVTKTFIKQTFWNNPTEISFLVDVATFKTRNEMQKPFWSHILALIPTIRLLEVIFIFGCDNSEICNSKGFIEALTGSCSSDVQPTAWYCSDLEQLRLKSANFTTEEGRVAFSLLIEHLQHRRQVGRGLRALHFISCSGITEEDKGKIERSDIAVEIIFLDE